MENYFRQRFDQKGNWLTVSSLNGMSFYEKEIAAVQIKFVLRGSECYILDKTKHEVNAGKLLVVNPRHAWDCFIPAASRHTVSFCVNINPSLLQDVHKNFALSENELLDNYDSFPGPSIFLERVYNEKECEVVKYLSRFKDLVAHSSSIDNLSLDDFFYNVSVKLISCQYGLNGNALSIKAKKRVTQLELYRRLSVAKEILDSNLYSAINIYSVASECNLSEFHFFRTFKMAYGVSPYKYYTGKKLELAAHLMSTTGDSISEVAYKIGYPDLSSFSRAFKHKFKISPVLWRDQNA